ncbi:cytidylyltransferase family-domain-containing protein [Mycena metata]|uniref:Phosphatidate cytidylyltransferase n=1 Tax=Mycena metata TaxID=1033252 RepID=A0AAD7P0Q3_9AGAR|nr:cytidylyltransferase family-domain-containing protein [Mycena metata]
MTSTRPSFASKTTFDSLAVDSGEETEEEEIPEPPAASTTAVPEAEPKPTKSALKKAARAARKQLQQQAKAKPSRGSSTEPSSVSPSGSAFNPVEIPHEVEPAPTQETERPLANGAAAKVESTPPPAILAPETQPPPLQPPPLQSVAATPAPPQSAAYVPPKPVQILPPPVTVPAPREHAPHVVEKVAENPALAAEQTKKRQNVLTRTLWTFIMIGTFIVLLLLGHTYMILLVMLCQTLVYREVTALFSLTSSEEESKKNGKDPWSTTLNWYFFVVTNYFLYGESIIYYFKHVVFADAQMLPFATNHRIISFTLYTIGFVGFVMSLQKGYLKQQFGLFCWVHMSLLIIVLSSHFIINNILEGMIWFWVPASLVICNDVFAYIWGITIGRTPLIALSPKKTVEGFVGAFWSTMIFGVIYGTYFMQFYYMICPVHDLGVSAWSSVACTPNTVFVWREWQIWTPLAVPLSTLLGRSVTTIPYAPYQFHLLCLSAFASLVAPFGGFFASGFKRAFNIKDFGHSIPGHGGMTDRMDCQFLMGVFVYVYHSSIIREHHVTVGSVLQTIVSGLTLDEQLALVADLQRYLSGQGISIPCVNGLVA